jgi:hypothetical protein
MSPGKGGRESKTLSRLSTLAIAIQEYFLMLKALGRNRIIPCFAAVIFYDLCKLPLYIALGRKTVHHKRAKTIPSL